MTAETAGAAPSRRWQRGQILPAFCLILALLLLPVAGLAVDGGLLISTHASLLGASQAAAEAGAQAVDVTALESSGVFELCASPDGGSSCGNGVGTVGEVVGEVLSASDPELPTACRDDGAGPPAVDASANGCAFALISKCGTTTGAARPEGVTVLAWRTVPLPLLAFAGWGDTQLTATATAWLQHGYGGGASAASSIAGQPC